MIVPIGNIVIGDRSPLVLFAGPCVVESRDMALRAAEHVRNTAAKHSTPVVYKSSYKKANRTSGNS
ncbi:MAG: 3-deoxy-8-phosphooctulonate synthase, partial [Bacteroidota bacterium]